jgi:KUP system potassium uptake protein
MPVMVIGLVLFAIMTTWRKGSEVLTKQLESSVKTLETIIGKVEHESPARVPGTGVFFTSDANASPLALQHHLRYTRSLHEQVVIIQVVVEHIPKVDANDRLQVEKLNSGFYKVITRYGFMQGINVPSDLANCQQYGLKIDDLGEVAYYMSRKSSIPGRKKHEIAIWRSRLFAFLARNTGSTPSQYQIPSDQLIEVGIHVGI